MPKNMNGNHRYIINEKFTDLKGTDNKAFDTGGKDEKEILEV